MEQLLADGGHLAGAVLNGVVPLHKTAVHGPAAEVQGKRRPEKSKLLADLSYAAVADVQLKLGQERQHPLLHRGDVLPLGAQNMQAMTPGELSLHGIGHAAVLMVDVVAVEPREKPLLEIQLHRRTSLSVQYTVSRGP